MLTNMGKPTKLQKLVWCFGLTQNALPTASIWAFDGRPPLIKGVFGHLEGGRRRNQNASRRHGVAMAAGFFTDLTSGFYSQLINSEAPHRLRCQITLKLNASE